MHWVGSPLLRSEKAQAFKKTDTQILRATGRSALTKQSDLLKGIVHPPYQDTVIIPVWIATNIASVRSLTSSFALMVFMWFLTVNWLSFRVFAPPFIGEALRDEFQYLPLPGAQSGGHLIARQALINAAWKSTLSGVHSANCVQNVFTTRLFVKVALRSGLNGS